MRHLSGWAVGRWGLLGLLALAGCIEPYAPDLTGVATNYLVVDGFINGNGRTRIKLSRSTGVLAATVPTERGARLAVMDDAGTRYALTETSAGSYRSDSLQLNPARRYQLRITTAAGVIYASNLVPLKVTPPIDQLGFRRDNAQVQVLVSAHDPQGQTRYYRWGFTETWQFHAAFDSKLEYYPPPIDDVLGRTTPIYTCWRTEQQSSIRQGTTAQQAQDVLVEFPALVLSARAERFTIRYSALVSQYAETPEEYAYYEVLRKNTEDLGTVNDPLPSQVTGNVRRLDRTNEPVLGYVGAHTVEQKRIFIDNQALNLPPDWVFISAYPGCELSLGPTGGHSPAVEPIDYFYDINYPPTSPTGIPDQCYYAPVACADCRVRGTTTKPAFW